MNVRLTQEQKVKVLNSEDVFLVMQQVLLRENKIRRNQEHFWVVGLDNENKILFVELISLGAVNIVQVNPPEVFRMAIYKMAVRMILIHNHPSGNTQASESDRDLTDRLIKTGHLINIEVIDHLIISENNYISLSDKGIIDELKNSGLYEILDADKLQVQKWKEEMEREKAVLEEKLNIARKFKENGVDIEIIKKSTGLKISEIEKL